MRKIKIQRLLLAICLFVFANASFAELIIETSGEVELSASEQKTLKLILNREETLQDLTGAVAGLEAVNEIAEKVVSGPARVLVEWNKALIDGWKKANNAMRPLADDATCKSIDQEIVTQANTPNEGFWKNLRVTAGCR